jgi:hypothetical protein
LQYEFRRIDITASVLKVLTATPNGLFIALISTCALGCAIMIVLELKKMLCYYLFDSNAVLFNSVGLSTVNWK